ncbi:MAG: TIGR01906 family membrane protein [Anaerolineae bacterium]|nr:TIGR01906 family membrane protein [Anaerolineae bacterium]
MTTKWLTIVKWLIIIAMPLFLGFTMITLTVSPAYPTYEYAKATFPADPLGLTQAQRLDLALVAVDYLGRWDAAEDVIFMLADQVDPNTGEPWYLQSELDHMVDVKKLTDAIRIGAIVAGLIVIIGTAALLWRQSTRYTAYQAIFGGGVFTAIILAAIALFILLAWQIFFVEFHELLFPPGSWTFYYTDGLIRLFPEKFWFDFGVILSMGSLILGIGVALLGYLLMRRARKQGNVPA